MLQQELLKTRRGDNLKTTIHEGKFAELNLGKESILVLDMPRAPREARMSFRVDQLLGPFLGKNVKITIEEDKGNILKMTIEVIKK